MPLKHTPIESLYVEAHEAPLKLRCKKLALRYYLKLKSNPSNSAYQCTFNPNYKHLFDKKENAIKPFGLYMEKMIKPLTDNLIDKTTIHEFKLPEHPLWLLERPKVILKLAAHTKSDTHPLYYIEKLNYILEQYPDWAHIYTDGSKVKNKVGCAAIFKSTTEKIA